MFEVLPAATNRLTLSTTKKDALGIPTLAFHYDLTDAYVLGARDVCRQDYASFTAAMGGTVITKETGWQNHAHVMGTVMMGTDARTSVTNHEGRSWDHPNLFLATTGLLPSSGAVNPTLAGIALGLRTADVIAREV